MTPMRRLRSSASLLSAVLLIASATPTEVAPSEPITLHAETTIKADGIQTGQLHLPQDVRIDLNEDPQRPGNAIDVTIEGGGDGLVAVAIVPAGEVSGYDVVRLPTTEEDLPQTIVSLGSGCRECDLPAGLYDFVVVATGEVTVTLSLDELDPADDLEPTVLQRSLEGAVFNEASVTTTHGDGAVLGGDAHAGAGWRGETSIGSGRGVLQTFDAFWYSGIPSSEVPDDELLLQVGLATPCKYSNPPASELLFHPGCPTGSMSGVQQVIALQGREVSGLSYGWSSGVLEDEFARGGVATFAGVRDVGAAGYWVELP